MKETVIFRFYDQIVYNNTKYPCEFRYIVDDRANSFYKVNVQSPVAEKSLFVLPIGAAQWQRNCCDPSLDTGFEKMLLQSINYYNCS